MAVFVGATPPKLCSLCDAPAMFVAMIRIKILDEDTNKLVATEVDFVVCQDHAAKMDIEIDKKLKPIVESKRLILLP